MSEAAIDTSMEMQSTNHLDIDSIREQFPILKEIVYGKKLVYLDNAASSQKPLAVTDSLTNYYASQHANVHRGVHALSDRATESL